MNRALSNLIELLDLEPIEENIFRGQNEGGRDRPRLFGGQVAAQALAAAGRTVQGLTAHSLHAYFLRPGDPAVPVVFTVDRIRDGSSFTTRRVVAVQHGKAIFNMAASFHKEESGFSHQDDMPAVDPPESFPTWEERMREVGDRLPEPMRSWARTERAFEMRSTEVPTWIASEPSRRPNRVWIRTKDKLPDDPFLHQCLLTYASDMGLVDSIYRPHVRGGPRMVMMASLDHAMWFHRALRVDDWLLYSQESPSASGGRGFARGTLYTREGTLVCSVAQEGLMRPLREPVR